MRIKKGMPRKTHGMSKTPTYKVWESLLSRCYNPNNSRYHRYGGRGIGVCDEWRHSFETFLIDMGKSPDGMQLDRMDNDQGYSKSNCRWATRTEQQNNTRRNRHITAFGKTQTISQWSREIGVSRFAIRDRLDKGMLPEDAITASALCAVGSK